ncbi:hypothetical protein ETAA8_29280 [Anatilimnocola aggregata]|uniref:3-keto-alpha-glucoside-1,2-lyase/3-keto-2-hydroxy-glucal hydratase domain-containing protein n=1 Tax=Anatilimnocola aggregata TaxID=2528021 RepID=A0A517YC70_9BACT|nr:DUF1080 domain-containing protein [Anatilimnocola aggregata]QDU27837.1 hypothetical protein ETAA8_29280 [Anatilimnocola aggregata]
MRRMAAERIVAALVLAWMLVLAGTAVQAADPPKDKNKKTFLDATEAGLDYALQGELVGAARAPGWGYVNTGLQVIANGDGKFDAVLYRGGLPGAGWDRTNKLKLSGQTNEQNILWVENENLKIAVTAADATVFDIYGNIAGNLQKTRRISPTMGLLPPAGAVVLFNGQPTEELKGAKLTKDNLLLAGTLTKMPVGDFRLHLEFRSPFMPYAKGQARGNSGVYIQQRYEVQILDSFGLEGVENECGGLYKQKRPDINMCLPPLTWQTYDIYFSQARWSSEDSKKKTQNARITVLQNGVPIHWHREIPAKTGGGKAEAPEIFPINLQDHGNPVTFRNIWIVPDQGDVIAPAVNYQSCCGRRRCR